MRLSEFSTVTLDVVGTLIDFETGILRWFRTLLERNGVSRSDEEILSSFATSEDECHRKAPEMSFTDMLRFIYREMAAAWGMEVNERDALEFRQSMRTWPVFPDTVAALKELGTVYRLVAVTNADARALEHMNATMKNPFDEQVSGDEGGANKPSTLVFEYALRKLAPKRVRKLDILHAAQSQYHDIIPAHALGLSTMWIERRYGMGTYGATPTRSEVVTPDFHATSMADFVRQVRKDQAGLIDF